MAGIGNTALAQEHDSKFAQEAWADLMAAYLAAKQAEDDYAAREWNPAFARENEALNAAGGGSDIVQLRAQRPDAVIPGEVSDEMERLVDVRGNLEDALMAAPAPDGEALRWKLDYLLARDEDGYSGSYSTAFLAQTVADYRRILGAAA